ncbi:MAG: phasin family protein [Endomicrobiales bacterium]
MNKLLTRFIDLQLGLIAVTRDRVKAVVDELIDTGDIGREEGDRLVDELVQKGEKSREEMKKQVEETVADALSRLDVPTRKEINELKLRIEQLRRDFDKEMLEHVFTDRTGF